MTPEDAVFDRTAFVHNRERFRDHGLVEAFFTSRVLAAVREQAVSQEHFSVDGSLIEAFASMKSVKPKSEEKKSNDSNSWHDFSGKKRSNETHESKTDPEARLARKSDGQETKLSHSLHVMMENRNGILMDVRIAEASGGAERRQAIEMLKALIKKFGPRKRTLGADKGYDDSTFLWQLQHRQTTPHVAIRDGEIKDTSWMGKLRMKCRRRAQFGNYQMSQHRRRRVEAIIGWLKKVAGLERTRFVGRWKTQLYAYIAGTALNLLKLSNLELARAS
jgi:hypothetical protein